MEKVTIKSVKTKKEGEKNGKPYKIFEVELSDGRKGDSFSDFKEGEECEIEIKPNDNPKYNANFTKVGAKKAFPVKDWTTEKRICALNNAVALWIAGKVPPEKFNECRGKFFEYLNTK